ncbi:hypothetical protein SRRS_35710 [Sporomusa rhizae]
MTFIIKDLDKATTFFEEIFKAKEIWNMIIIFLNFIQEL